MISLATRGYYSQVVEPSPFDGEILSITGSPVTRWTSVVAVVRVSGGSPFVRYVSNSLKLWIYDPVDGFTANFRDRSTVAVDGDVVTMSIIPNGGWWTNQFRLKFISGTELDAAP